MPEPLAEHLSRFTPDEAGLDRDSLLFAAGRASVRPNRRWMALAGMLAASQLLTFVFLWPRTPPARIDTPTVAIQQPEPAPLPIPHDPSELGILSGRLLASEGNWIPSIDDGPTIAPEPPLRVFGPLPAKYLN
jgi:hypothetical protein